jgi:hypothetical protein
MPKCNECKEYSTEHGKCGVNYRRKSPMDGCARPITDEKCSCGGSYSYSDECHANVCNKCRCHKGMSYCPFCNWNIQRADPEALYREGYYE